MATNDGVYVGFWRDYHYGPVLGSRLTLSSQNGATLVALLAVLVTIASASSWKFWRLAFHFLGTVTKNQGLAGIRDSVSDVEAFKRSMKSVRQKPKEHLLPIVLAFTHWCLFIGAGILTSKVSMNNTVIGNSQLCGWWQFYEDYNLDPLAAGDLPSGQLDWLISRTNASIAAENYARTCYETENIADCTRLVSRKLEWTETHNASCPFESGICLEGDTAAFTLDTGYVPFSKLGINVPFRLSVRRRTTCSPINNELFIYPRDDNGHPNGSTEQNNAYGKYNGSGIAYLYSHASFNGTNVTYATYIDGHSGYSTLVLAMQGEGFDGVLPHKPLRVANTSLSIFYLSLNAVAFRNPSYDPLFHATRPIDLGSRTVYVRSEYATTLACIDQQQLCNNDTEVCGPFESLNTLHPWLPYDNRTASTAERAATNFVFIAGVWSALDQSASRGSSVLLRASEFYQQHTQLKIGREQWKTEVSHWFSIGLAQIQLTLLRLVFSSPTLNKTNLPNMLNTTKAHDISCRIVKFNSAGHLSFSTFGVFFVAIVSLFIFFFPRFWWLLRKLFIKLPTQRPDPESNERGRRSPLELEGSAEEGVNTHPQHNDAATSSALPQHDGTRDRQTTGGLVETEGESIELGESPHTFAYSQPSVAATSSLLLEHDIADEPLITRGQRSDSETAERV